MGVNWMRCWHRWGEPFSQKDPLVRCKSLGKKWDQKMDALRWYFGRTLADWLEAHTGHPEAPSQEEIAARRQQSAGTWTPVVYGSVRLVPNDQSGAPGAQ